MDKIQIIPAIEIKDGKTIEAVKWHKGDYKEVEIEVGHSSNPLDTVRAYAEIGFSEVYISDLNGILEDNPDYELLKQISFKLDVKIMADIGVWTPEDVLRLSKIKPVISSETFTSLNFLEFPNEFVLAIDMRDDVFLSGMNIKLPEFLDIILGSSKIREVLILDLSRSEASGGPNTKLCSYILDELPGVTTIYGGGVNSMADVKKLYDLGVNKVIVESALSSGEMLKEIYSGFAKG
jgi:HisA/HisF family protein